MAAMTPNVLKNILRVSQKLLLFVILLVFVVNLFTSIRISALSEAQQKMFRENINYFNVDTCGGNTDGGSTPSDVSVGTGKPDGAVFPNLDPDGMAKSIDKFIQKENPKSEMKGLGTTIVAGAKAANINPFLIVAIAHKETSLSDPSDFNVSHGNNSFGRQATSSQPNFVGAHVWYKWSSVKASVDNTADENKNAAGGGDIAAYIRNQYKDTLDNSDLLSLFLQYAPAGENNTTQYVANVKGWISDMVDGVGSGGASASAAPASCCPGGGAGGGAYSGSISPQVGKGISAEGQQNLQKAAVEAGQKFDVDPNFIAAFYYAENDRTGDSTNNANSATGTPVTGDGKWRDPAPPYGKGGPWPSINFASALGPWQFITSTWKQYKPPGSDDTSDRNDLFKSGLAAGKYLAALGAKNGANEAKLKQAAFGYNHSDTYAQSVVNTYKYLKGGGSQTVSGDGSSGDASCGGGGGGAGIGAYKDPYRDVKQKTPLRIDMGLDYAGVGPIYAIGNGKVNVVYKRNGGSGWPGWGADGAGGWVSYTLSDGPAAGKTVYFAENCVPTVKVGDPVTTDTKICELDGLTSAWSESGWAADKTTSSAAAHVEWRGHDSSAYYTAYGENFSQLINKLGERPGTKQAGAQKIGTLPDGWPTWQ